MIRTRLTSQKIQAIVNDYSIPLSERALATKYKLGRGVIRRVLIENSVRLRSKHERTSPKLVKYVCSYCGNHFKDFISNRSQYTNVFCNLTCKGHWMSKCSLGEKSSNWKGGYPQLVTYEYKWSTIRSEVLKVQKKCEDCGSITQLHVHHKLPRRIIRNMYGMSGLRNANNLLQNNYSVYCSKCHPKHESDYKQILGGATTIISGAFCQKSTWDSLDCVVTRRSS